MKKFERATAPDFLLKHYKKWGRSFARRRTENSSAEFSWPKIGGSRLNQLLLPELKAMTQSHCSFCDAFPVETVSSETIEHFRPKTKFPRLAYCWINLFYCCSKCQESKREHFDSSLLRPDSSGYSFDYFFQYHSGNGEIFANPDRMRDDSESYSAAEVTIELYGFNKFSRPQARQRTVRQFLATADPILEEFPYRFVLENV